MSHQRRSLIDSPWQDHDRIDLTSLGPLHLGTFEKTLFSMATPEVISLLNERGFKSLVLLGIEVRRPQAQSKSTIT
jgi:hypothetical protein